MGLDMFLFGVEGEGGDEIELGYWRKHPNLHGYIVQTFAGGVDDCQYIPLTVEQLKQTLQASEEDSLPYTTGFFFGVSQPDHDDATKEILTKAIAWLNENPNRKMFYHASW